MKTIDFSNKKDCVMLVAFTVNAMQKVMSVEKEGNEDIHQRVQRFFFKKTGKDEKYLASFIKMNELGDKIKPIQIMNLVFYIKHINPCVDAMLVSNGLDIPDMTPSEIMEEARWKEEDVTNEE